jgi:hypothetical protein
MPKLKELNDIIKIIHKRSFKNLLKLSNIFSQNLSYAGLFRAGIFAWRSPSEFAESKFKNQKMND